MKISAISRGGVVRVDAHTRDGVFVLLDPVDVAFAGGGFFRIPTGFPFDGASIPARARSIIQSLTTAGSVLFVVHDAAYSIGATWTTPSGARIGVSRARADKMAAAVCEYLGLSPDDAFEIYAALRIGAGGSYRQRAISQTVEEWVRAAGPGLT